MGGRIAGRSLETVLYLMGVSGRDVSSLVAAENSS